MPKVDNRNIYEERPWLNDDVQNRTGLRSIVNGGGSDITVEAVTFTENGTFTAPAGKAYSPVTVNVPSDFSTATVTSSTDSTANFELVSWASYGEKHLLILDELPSETSVAVPLIMGEYYAPIDTDYLTVTVVEGDAEVITYQDGTFLYVTGNCTIKVDGLH